MGAIPPYDPFTDRSLIWVVATVMGIEPTVPTWSTPGVLVLEVERVLRGKAPAELRLRFDQPRHAGQAMFYASRGGDHAAARELGKTRIETPSVGTQIIAWTRGPAPAQPRVPGGAPIAPDPSDPWFSPTVYQAPCRAFPLHSRWVDVEHLALVEQELASR